MWNTDKLPSGRGEGWNCIHLCSASPLLILKIKNWLSSSIKKSLEKLLLCIELRNTIWGFTEMFGMRWSSRNLLRDRKCHPKTQTFCVQGKVHCTPSTCTQLPICLNACCALHMLTPQYTCTEHMVPWASQRGPGSIGHESCCLQTILQQPIGPDQLLGPQRLNLCLFCLIWSSFFLLFLTCHMAYGIIVLWPGIKPWAKTVRTQSPAHFTPGNSQVSSSYFNPYQK